MMDRGRFFCIPFFMEKMRDLFFHSLFLSLFSKRCHGNKRSLLMALRLPFIVPLCKTRARKENSNLERTAGIECLWAHLRSISLCFPRFFPSSICTTGPFAFTHTVHACMHSCVIGLWDRHRCEHEYLHTRRERRP